MSCFYIVIHLDLYWKHSPLKFLLWVSNFVSIIVGLFFCYAGLFSNGREDGYVQLSEPLSKNSSIQNKSDDRQGSCVGGEGITSYANANVLSIVTFSWMGPLLALGYKKTLDLEDVPQLVNRDSANVIFSCFMDKLESDGDGGIGGRISTLKLVKTLIHLTWKEVLLTTLFYIVSTLASYIGPYLINIFVNYLNSPLQLKYKGYALVSIFFISKLIRCLSDKHLFFQLRKMAIRVRAALLAIIYKKGLGLSIQSKLGYTIGENTNLISVDVERIALFCWYLHDIWRVPVQVVLALLILYKYLGLASLVAFFATLILMLANVPLGKLQKKFQESLMDSKDRRMKVTTEALRYMRFLKLQGWEMKFLAMIIDIRNFETRWLKKLLYTSALTTVVYLSAPMFVSMVTFGFCVLMGISLESGKILSAIATFEILKGAIYNLPDTIFMIVQTKVSIDRIASFLYLDDFHPNIVQKLPRDDDVKVAVEAVKGNFSWDLHSPNLTLKDLNFRVYHGSKVAICGSVGSGKSSLLSCILGEVPKVSGAIKLNGTKAYVAQSPWIQSGKIVDNILFGKKMDKERYDMILEACSLKKDLELCAFGDQTIIGDRGINLSGGQKQRIQIARALYHDADIYLLDDPFSAVDAHTGAHLYKECLLRILGSKTVIYVTHQVEFLPSADLILVMKNGRITQAGKYEEILSSGTDFMELIGAHKKALVDLNSFKPDIALDNLISGEEDGNMMHIKKSIQDDEDSETKNRKTEKLVRPEGQLVQEEKREKGEVSLSIYWEYVTTAYKGAFVPLILLAQILFQLLLLGSTYWMVWATPVSGDVRPHVRGSTLIFVYVVLTLGCSFCLLIRSMLIVTVGYKTATLLFNKMHLCIFRASQSFFDSTPSGRILNRASIDQSALDTSIPHQIEELLITIIEFLGIAAVMSQIAWQMFIVFIPMIVICIWYQQYYKAAARELSRLFGVCQAPIIQHFSESTLGSTTIRCFNQEERFIRTNLKLVDEYSRPKFYFSGAIEWLCFRIDMLASFTYAISLVFLISELKGALSPGVMGMAVIYGLGFSMHGVVWDLSILESKIISVERILQYAFIPSEPPLLIEENRPGRDWPSQGKIDIIDLQVRYAPHLPLVLQGITCTFHEGMKIGIVGRTGSGKSTLVHVLFRMLEPAAGQILIDDINISKIGLHDLRSRMSIIPQDPIIFEGTLRSNLDPLEEYTDEQIWEALDRCQLGDEVRKNEGKLDFEVTENGDNWSMGQRQLICLARVLLKRSKILVLDEATASVDTATDYVIQQTLRKHFSGSTVITIAHRLTSVLDLDRVLLLDNGVILEYDTPAKLLDIKSSSFTKLVNEYTRRCSS
ncbi:ABC transporter C family member 3-like [Macadamia integrifolia]|uniref:ABC transporter C family member 3-like n=1 Tax=Macadamia integrifolia TaxID=60698 RepID=UPI001C4E344A|nr:ABC transporter C family member 3-like [Macadamia integrifolia]